MTETAELYLLRHMSNLETASLICSFVLSALGLACDSTQPQAATRAVKPEYDRASGRLQRIESDANGDGKIDTWGYMDGMRVIRVEVDEDGDGKVDRWEYYGSDSLPGTSSRQAQTPERIERSVRHDGRVSRWEYFEHGVLVRVEEDTDGDGRLDKWETYRGGALETMGLDTERRGKPDRRLVYKPDGSLDHIEADPTGSGVFRALIP